MHSKQAFGRLTAVRQHLTSRPASSAAAVRAQAGNGGSAGIVDANETGAQENPKALSSFYQYFLPFQTKWHENDMYDHLNNAVYITYFDAIINEYLVRVCGMVPSSVTSPIGLVISSSFNYKAALEFPDPILAGLSVMKLGKSSVTYAIALFSVENIRRTSDLRAANQDNDTGHSDFTYTFRLKKETKAACFGEMTHVFVDPKTRRPIDMSQSVRSELARLLVQ